MQLVLSFPHKCRLYEAAVPMDMTLVLFCFIVGPNICSILITLSKFMMILKY